MITVKEFLETINYQITEGWSYQWHCFGDNAYGLDHHDPDFDERSLSIIFDKKDQTVYTAEVHDYKNNRSYRLLNPNFAKAHKDECIQRGIDDLAWENVKYTDLETKEDWLEKAQAIFDGEPYDDRVSVPLDIPEEELFKYMVMAHERDMTFNQFIEEALRSALADEGFINRVKETNNVGD